jgi:hypothetical protein
MPAGQRRAHSHTINFFVIIIMYPVKAKDLKITSSDVFREREGEAMPHPCSWDEERAIDRKM